MKHLHIRTKIGLALTTLGLLGLLLPIIYFRWYQPGTQVARPTAVAPINQQLTAASKAEQVVSGHPNHIYIPSLDMSFAVTDGAYDQKTGQWTLSADHVQYASITALPNSKMGNTFIYGHATRRVFGRLPQLKDGAQALIHTDNGYTFEYSLVSVRETNPQDTSIFNYQGPPQLTVQTCSGAWSQNRQFFTFKYVGYQKDPQVASVRSNP